MRERSTDILPYPRKTRISPFCPRDFYETQNDKHSDLTVCKTNGVTVMAVAADSHCDFLIPARTVRQYARQRKPVPAPDELCLFLYAELL